MGTALQSPRWMVYMLVALVWVFASVIGEARMQIEIWGNQAHLRALQPLIDEFNASQDRIEVIIPGKSENPDVILGAHLAGQLPAIIESARVFTHHYAREGLMADLTPFIAREGPDFLGDFVPMTLATDNMVDGKIYSLPSFLQIVGLFYNPDLFDQAGVAPPAQGWTWDDLREYSQRLRRYNAENEKEIWGLVSEHPFHFDWMLLGQAGGAFVDEDYQVTVNSSPFRMVHNWTLDMVRQDLLSYTHIHPGASAARPHNAGIVAVATYRQDFWNQHESPMMPTPPLRYQAGSEPTTIFSDRSWAIMNVSPEEQEAAWEVIKYLVSPEVNARWNMALGYPPATFSAIQHPAFFEYAFNEQPNLLIWSEQYITVPNVIPWPNPLYLTNVWDIATELHTAFIRQELALEAHISELERRLDQVIAEFLETNVP